METLAALRQACRNALGVPPSDPLVSNERLDGWLNAACQELSVERDWPWLEALDSTNTATVEDQADYVLPADWRDTLVVTIEDRPLRRISKGTAAGFDYYGDWHSTYHYSLDGEADVSGPRGYLTISPTPGEALDLVHRYIADEPMMAADNAEPLLPKRWRYALVSKACASAALSIDHGSDADRFRNEYDAWIRKMLRHVRPKPRVYIRPGGML